MEEESVSLKYTGPGERPSSKGHISKNICVARLELICYCCCCFKIPDCIGREVGMDLGVEGGGSAYDQKTLYGNLKELIK